MAQLEQAYEASLTMLANAIEVRNEYTRGHVERVTAYALIIGEKLGWQGKRLDQVRYGAILHDIGKIHVSEDTLTKNEPLNENEWAEIKRHPVTGAEMIKYIPYLTNAIPVVRYHHERWDGLGYPDGKRGEDIPQEARIVAVADSFDAMTSTRPYHPAFSLEQAYYEIVNCSGVHFDPQVVAAFQKAWEDGDIQKIALQHSQR